MNHDFVLLRYADVLLSKAEAHFRTGDATGALGIVNQIRVRAGVTPFNSLTEDQLLAERGREMYVENDRRRSLSDLVNLMMLGGQKMLPMRSINFTLFQRIS